MTTHTGIFCLCCPDTTFDHAISRTRHFEKVSQEYLLAGDLREAKSALDTAQWWLNKAKGLVGR